MASSKVICWNSSGIWASAASTDEKIAFFDNAFPEGKFAIAAFVETHHKDEHDFPQDMKEYGVTHHILHTPTDNTETHGGIIVLISKEYDIISQKVYIPGRLINIKCIYNITKKEHNISVFYGPIWHKMKKNDITKILENFNELHNMADNNIILGDFNFVDTDIDKQKNMRDKDKMINSFWENFKSETGIVDPYRTQYPKKKCYSYIAPQGKSRVDRVYISEDNIKTVSKFKYVNTPFNTAHKIMAFDLEEHQQIGPNYWKMNSTVLNDEPYRNEIEEVIQGVKNLNITDPIDRWDMHNMVWRSVTQSYTIQKSEVKKKLKTKIIREIQRVEEVQYDNMTAQQKEDYLYFKGKYNEIIEDEIKGHRIRTRGQPTYELNEPNIQFFAKLEKRSQQKNIITELQDKNGKLQTENEELLKVAEDYYTKLYTPSKTDIIKQQRLLKNIDKTISITDRQKLDAPITQDELKDAVQQLQNNKSPGLDGITEEFYKTFWLSIKDDYLEYINAAKVSSFREHRNTSVTTIIYKHKGEIYILSNYRPISLINIDLKILSKTLTNRLKFILPTIIHQTQTAIQGRKIDHTIHLIRDLIELVDKEESQAAFIFLDQEKAFDRVDHDFLYKVMEGFGIGIAFIKWVQVLYSNATTKIKINGHLSNNIPLGRGVRQGCPLSALLYVLVIEVLALQLRKNPNIVGFTVDGEKIISLHYADDAIITLKQNQCFKEVIKDISDIS